MSTHQTALFPYGGTPSCFGITSNGGSSLLPDQALLPPADEIRLAGCGQMRRKTADRAVAGIRDADKLPVNLSGSLLPGKILHDGCDTDAVGVLDLELPLLEPVLPSCHRCDVKVVLCKEKGEKAPVMRTVCPRPSVLSASSLRFFSTAAAAPMPAHTALLLPLANLLPDRSFIHRRVSSGSSGKDIHPNEVQGVRCYCAVPVPRSWSSAA